MDTAQLNALFFEQARQRDEEARLLLNCRPGRFLKEANESNALSVAISYINRNGRSPTDGFIRLMNAYKETRDERIKQLPLEALFIEFYEAYSQTVSDAFPPGTVRYAKALMDWR